MKHATLVLIRRREEVLLPQKKTGEIGRGLYNAPGGKLELGESPITCALREVREETGLRLYRQFLEECATLSCYTKGVLDFRVYVYRTGVFKGEPQETESMTPCWFHWAQLPYELMHDGDVHWFSKALGGQKFDANLYYRGRGEGFEKIQFAPYTPFPVGAPH